MASLPIWVSIAGSHRVFNATSCRYGDRTASQSSSRRAPGRSRLQRRVNSSSRRPATSALVSSTETVSIPTRRGRQHAVTSIANLDTNGTLTSGSGARHCKPSASGPVLSNQLTRSKAWEMIRPPSFLRVLHRKAEDLLLLIPSPFRGEGRKFGKAYVSTDRIAKTQSNVPVTQPHSTSSTYQSLARPAHRRMGSLVAVQM